MTFSSCLNDRDEAVVLDASVIINLLATGNASAILQALPAVPFVTGNVVREIGQGVANDRSEPALLAKLISDQVLRRSEERRVGKECVSTCRSRWSTYH